MLKFDDLSNLTIGKSILYRIAYLTYDVYECIYQGYIEDDMRTTVIKFTYPNDEHDFFGFDKIHSFRHTKKEAKNKILELVEMEFKNTSEAIALKRNEIETLIIKHDAFKARSLRLKSGLLLDMLEDNFK